MKQLLGINLVLALVFTGASAFATTPVQTPTFKIRVNAKLTRLIGVPGVPGVVQIDGEAAADEKVVLSLSDCYALVDGGVTCGGSWSKQLTLAGKTMSYFVNVWNKKGSAEHTIILNICPSGEAGLSQCPATESGSIKISDSSVPNIRIFPTQAEDSAPFFQPVLEISNH